MRRRRRGRTGRTWRMCAGDSLRGCGRRCGRTRRGGRTWAGPDLHPTAGACAVGARKFLVAYNICFDSADVAMARAIAREMRRHRRAEGREGHGDSGARAGATGVEYYGFSATPISLVYRKVANLATRHKDGDCRGEVMGLIPEAACERESEWMRLLSEFDPATKILERRLERPLAWPGESRDRLAASRDLWIPTLGAKAEMRCPARPRGLPGSPAPRWGTHGIVVSHPFAKSRMDGARSGERLVESGRLSFVDSHFRRKNEGAPKVGHPGSCEN